MVNTSETKNEKLQNNEATVQVMKQPKTFAQQVEIIKEKGFIIDNDTECIGFLKQANYYRLSAYFLPFRKKDGTYFSNINFHRIQRIYEFDSRLRGVLFNYIEKVELYLRTTLDFGSPAILRRWSSRCPRPASSRTTALRSRRVTWTPAGPGVFPGTRPSPSGTRPVRRAPARASVRASVWISRLSACPWVSA